MRSTTAKPIALTKSKVPMQSSHKMGEWLGALGLLLLTLFIYIPTYKAGFIWDDDVIAANPLLKEGWRGLRDIWFSTKFGDFVPLTATTFWIEWQIHGAMKEIQHATNVVLQALNALLLWRILLRLGIPGAWIVAAIFAVHPISVASVTWLAERKNTLSMFFYLLSLLFYLKSDAQQALRTAGVRFGKFYWISFVFFLLGLFSKSSVVVLPVMLVLIAWWRHGKIERATIIRVTPFFGFALAAGIGTIVGHHFFAPKIGIVGTEDNLLVRTLTAGQAFWFYLSKDLLPVGLTMVYPRWNLSPASAMAYIPALAIIGIFSLFWKFRQTWGRACLFGFGYFVLALGPTIGVINMTYLTLAPVADHFQYMALPGIVALLVAGGCYWMRRAVPMQQQPLFAGAAAAIILLPLIVLSWRHQTLVGNAEALWRDNIKKNPGSWTAHNNLAGILFERKEYEESFRLYRETLARRDDLSMIHVNAGRALFALQRTDEAIGYYNKALKLDPKDFKAHNNLGVALVVVGKTNEALAAFDNAVRLSPTDETFFENLARLLVESGEKGKAIALTQKRFERYPPNSIARSRLGQLLFEEGRLDEALVQYREAVRMSPNFVEARFGLAEILARLNQKTAAVQEWRTILAQQPGSVQVMANLAWAMATDHNPQVRNGKEAVILAERLCNMGARNNPRFLDLLAAAYAEAGRFPEAIKTAEEAVSLAETMNQRDLSTQFRSRIDLYRSGQPFRSS